ncbi:MAG: hypothetical protein JXJ19_01480 [Elusimicrobia bacterium]|nr:hypothetical protein [Elusimicrobiota bacterium]
MKAARSARTLILAAAIYISACTFSDATVLPETLPGCMAENIFSRSPDREGNGLTNDTSGRRHPGGKDKRPAKEFIGHILSFPAGAASLALPGSDYGSAITAAVRSFVKTLVLSVRRHRAYETVSSAVSVVPDLTVMRQVLCAV